MIEENHEDIENTNEEEITENTPIDSKPLVDILSEDMVYRRFIIHPDYIKPDGSISTYAFTKKSKTERGLSFDLKRLTNIEKAVIDRKKFRLCQLSVAFIRSIGLDCIHDPKENNYAHVLLPYEGYIPKSKKKKLSREASKPENINL